MSQFERRRAAHYINAMVDLVSRTWIAAILATQVTGVQVPVLS